MERKIYAIITAGGRGVRMGSGTPKQFLEFGGKPVLQHTIERFVETVPGISIITVLPEDCISYWNELCGEKHFECPQRVVPGGLTRFHSVRNALEKVPDGAIVMIQDGVRPLTSAALIRRLLERVTQGCHAAVPFTPVTDTLRSLDAGAPDPDRSRLAAVQTPQVFFSEDIKAAYGQAYDPAFTDDASVAAKKGIPVTLVPGDRYNIKVTTPEDLLAAEALNGRV